MSCLEEGFFAAFPQMDRGAYPHIDLGGVTDFGLASCLFQHFDLPDTSENRQRLIACYIERLEDRVREFQREGKGHLKPGVKELLATLSGDGRYRLGLLTGNACAGAWIKLRCYGLDSWFSIGAYGDDFADRNKLGPVAWRRAEKYYGESFALENIAVIGDTLRDINCARAFGACVIAVATGAVSAEILAKGEPNALMESFADLEATVAGIDSVFCS